MKKTQTKAFTNLVASIILLAFEIWAYVMTLDFKIVKKAAVQPATFPQIMCIGMMVFTVILLIQSVIKLQKMDPDDPMIQPAASINVYKRDVQGVIVMRVEEGNKLVSVERVEREETEENEN